MGLLSKAMEAMREAGERRRLEQQALMERMRPYFRGYDVYPDEINQQYTSAVCRKLMKSTLIKGIILAGGVIVMILFAREIFPVSIFLGFALLILFLAALMDFSGLLRFFGGNYDCYGAMVTNTRVEEHTHHDSDGTSTTTYTYFVSLNGIECEVSSREFRKVGIGRYCHFVRLNAKYRRHDKFYFFPCGEEEQYHIIGQHKPSDELRLYRPEKGSGGVVALAVLSGMGSFGMFIYTMVQHKEFGIEELMLPVGLAALMIVFIIINKLISMAKGRKKIEEKRRMYDRN